MQVGYDLKILNDCEMVLSGSFQSFLGKIHTHTHTHTHTILPKNSAGVKLEERYPYLQNSGPYQYTTLSSLNMC